MSNILESILDVCVWLEIGFPSAGMKTQKNDLLKIQSYDDIPTLIVIVFCKIP